MALLSGQTRPAMGQEPPAGTALHVPPGFDRRTLLARLNATALEHSPDYRRAVTRTSPLLFACTYLLHHLSSEDTDGRISFNQFHIDIARSARRWIRSDLSPGEMRDAWVAPRGAAKSTWALLINPMWALAHQHQRYIQAFSATGAQARGHLGTFRDELARNELLRSDYPDLCASVTDHTELYVARSGVAMGARGIDATTLGVKIGSQRPSALLLDDVEPDESNYDAGLKQKRLSTIVNAVFPMSLNAVVQWTGTTTARGSLVHDLVLSALGQLDRPNWVEEQNIRVHYYGAIVVDDDGSERSLWPQRWPLEYLQSIRHTRNYALNFANLPPSAGEGYWERRDIVVDPTAVATRRVLMVDPAVTHGIRADFTGLAVVGIEPGPRGRAVVEYARQVKVAPEGLRRIVAGILYKNRSVRVVRVEANQGGQVWLDALAPVAAEFPGVDVELFHTDTGKAVRFAKALDFYQRGWVVHARELPTLTEQQLTYPNVANNHDDCLDAVVAGLEYWLADRPVDEMAPR